MYQHVWFLSRKHARTLEQQRWNTTFPLKLFKFHYVMWERARERFLQCFFRNVQKISFKTINNLCQLKSASIQLFSANVFIPQLFQTRPSDHYQFQCSVSERYRHRWKVCFFVAAFHRSLPWAQRCNISVVASPSFETDAKHGNKKTKQQDQRECY